MTESFPLKWPIGRQQTPSYMRKDAAFSTTMARSRDELLKELKLLGASSVVISSNVGTYRKGGQDIMPTSQQQRTSQAWLFITNGKVTATF